jgi:hypothetical protein
LTMLIKTRLPAQGCSEFDAPSATFITDGTPNRLWNSWHHSSHSSQEQAQTRSPPLLFDFLLTEITQPCIHTCNGLSIYQLYLLPDLLEETDCKEDTPLTLPFCIVHFPLTVDNSDMN